MMMYLSRKGEEEKIYIPKEIDMFDALEILFIDAPIEEIKHYIRQLVWQNEQGLPQSMRND